MQDTDTARSNREVMEEALADIDTAKGEVVAAINGAQNLMASADLTRLLRIGGELHVLTVKWERERDCWAVANSTT